jgi:Spy/CpxP family protein refolding chaperone
MVRFRFALLSVAVLALAASGGRFLADTKDEPVPKHDHLERLAVKLKLDEKQKEAIRKIHAEYDAKADPVEHQIWALHHQEHQAMHKVLTETQRAMVPEAMKGLADQEFQKASAGLKLTDEQKMKIDKIRAEYEPKFHELAADKEKGEKVHKEFRELRHKMVSAIRADLTEEQRDKLPAFVREEHRFWRNAESRHEMYKALGDKLGVTAEQKDQFRKLHEEYDPKAKALHAELKTLHHEEHAAIEKVFTEDQKAKWKELMKGRLGGDRGEEKR